MGSQGPAVSSPVRERLCGNLDDIAFIALRRRRSPISAQGNTLGKTRRSFPTLKGLTRVLLVVSIGSPFQGDKSFSRRFPQGVYPGLELANAFGVTECVFTQSREGGVDAMVGCLTAEGAA